MRPLNEPYNSPAQKRSRWLYALGMTLVMGVGLFWRASGVIPPGHVSKYGGDALWALMVFLGLAVLLPRSSTLAIGISAAIFSFAVETSQLYHAPWIDAIRRTRLGALTLGSVFNWGDFAAYSLGILIGVIAERTAQARSTRSVV